MHLLYKCEISINLSHVTRLLDAVVCVFQIRTFRLCAGHWYGIVLRLITEHILYRVSLFHMVATTAIYPHIQETRAPIQTKRLNANSIKKTHVWNYTHLDLTTETSVAYCLTL